jgi:two-component system, NtrC family, response regulator PilR
VFSAHLASDPVKFLILTASVFLTLKTAMTKHVLVVDDEKDIRELLVLTLSRMSIEADTAANCQDAFARISERSYDLCLTDMRLPDGDGMQIVEYIAKNSGNTPVAVITAYGSTDNAVAALKAGAFDYLAKPIQLKQLRDLISSALSLPRAPSIGDATIVPRRVAPPTKSAAYTTATATATASAAATAAALGPQLIGESSAIVRARDLIAKLARSQAPVYIAGESGSGKEVAARLIHSASSRREARFVAVNCGAIPENLMESEFFGYKRGAFTGADSEREGFLHAADGGTLFLDEVADLPLAMQVKLLRVIQDKKVRMLGETNEKTIDFRIICATHKNLASKVAAGEFRQDLFYRLNVIELKMPALREISDDLPLLIEQLLARLSTQAGMQVPILDISAQTALRRYDYPGNVRELENILERALALCDGSTIFEQDLHLQPDGATPSSVVDATSSNEAINNNKLTMPLHDYLDRIEREQIMKALEQTENNRTQAARVLGVTFRSLRYRLTRLGID